MVIAFTMFFMHPVSLGISLGSALAYAVYLRGRKAIRFSLVFMLPMMVMAALINPAFNHEGATLLTYLPSGNPLTLESILYGLAAAAMLAAVVTWFSCYTAVMTSDKFVCGLSQSSRPSSTLCRRRSDASDGMSPMVGLSGGFETLSRFSPSCLPGAWKMQLRQLTA